MIEQQINFRFFDTNGSHILNERKNRHQPKFAYVAKLFINNE